MNALTFADKDMTETFTAVQPMAVPAAEPVGDLPVQLKAAHGLVLGLLISVGFWVVVGAGVVTYLSI